MELGGKNSSIVCADANLEVAVREVLAGATLNVSAPSEFSPMSFLLPY